MSVQRRVFMAGLGGAAAAIPLMAACSRDDEKRDGASRDEKKPAPPTPKQIVPEPLTGYDPGTVIHQEPVDTDIKGARAWRVHYATKDVNDVVHEASGLVIAPDSRGENRPILTWCHGTTGLGDAACPSAQPDPARELITYFDPHATQQIDYGVPGLQGFVDAGWVVCATDYQGLGTPGMHQYEVNRTNARDAVYIAHAASTLDAGAGKTLGAMGWSQGGGASAALAELDVADYGDLRLIGTVAMSPGVTTIALRNPTGIAAALTDKSVPPDSHLVMTLAGIQAANPSTLTMSEAFTELGVEILEAAWNNQPVHHLNDTIGRLFRLKGAVLNPNPPNFDAWKKAMIAGSAAARKPVSPVLVCVDSFDGGTVIPVAWQTGYVDAVKALGGDVEVRYYPNDDHFSLPQSCVNDARAWLTGKLK